MKRITQILASAVFVITVLTAYLAFDFAISNALSTRNSSSRKRPTHTHDHLGKHNQLHDDGKALKRVPGSSLSVLDATKSNQTIKHREIINGEHEHTLKQREHKRKKGLNAKAAVFHKGKTGIKLNKPHRESKNQRRRQTTTTTSTTSPPNNNQEPDDEGGEDEQERA